MSQKPASKKIVLVAAVAMIDDQQNILMAQRPEGKSMAGLWEFPGGKVEAGETPEAALVRELKEELGVTTKVSDFEALTFASHSYEDFHLLMPVFACKHWQGNVQGMEGQAIQWVPVSKLHELDTPPADDPLVVIIKKLFS